MFILLTIILFLAKYLLVAAIGMFMYLDLEVTKTVSSNTYTIYFIVSCATFFSLLFFVMGRRLYWLIVLLICGSVYVSMYNKAPEISDIHKTELFSEENVNNLSDNAKTIYNFLKNLR